MIRVEINEKLPSCNDYIKLCRTNKYAAARMKLKIEQQIGYYLLKLPRYDEPIKIHFHWVEGTARRDLDNVCFAKKFILDSMVKYKKLSDDNRKIVTAFTDTFEYKKGITKVVLEIEKIGESDEKNKKNMGKVEKVD